MAFDRAQQVDEHILLVRRRRVVDDHEEHTALTPRVVIERLRALEELAKAGVLDTSDVFRELTTAEDRRLESPTVPAPDDLRGPLSQRGGGRSGESASDYSVSIWVITSTGTSIIALTGV